MSELKQKANLDLAIVSAFEANVSAEELHITPDGNCFLSKDKNFAELHAKRTNQKLEVVKREDYIKSESKPKSKAELAAEKKAAQEAEEKATAELESAGKDNTKSKK